MSCDMSSKKIFRDNLKPSRTHGDVERREEKVFVQNKKKTLTLWPKERRRGKKIC